MGYFRQCVAIDNSAVMCAINHPLETTSCGCKSSGSMTSSVEAQIHRHLRQYAPPSPALLLLRILHSIPLAVHEGAIVAPSSNRRLGCAVLLELLRHVRLRRLQVLPQAEHDFFVVLREERRGDTVLAGAPCPPDTVAVRLDLVWELVVDHLLLVTFTNKR